MELKIKQKLITWVLFFLLILSFFPKLALTMENIKTFSGDQYSLCLYHNRMELVDNNNVVIDQYFVKPWVIIDGCLLLKEKAVIVILGKEGEIRGERLACFTFKNGTLQNKWIDNDHQINPWKILICDVEGDGRPEVAVGVWKTAKFHPVFDNRLFIYAWEKEMIYPKWLGSRLSSPFVDFDFRDINQDGIAELIALEYQKDGLKRIIAYEWTGFGFRGIAILGKNLLMDSISEFFLKGRDFNEIH